MSTKKSKKPVKAKKCAACDKQDAVPTMEEAVVALCELALETFDLFEEMEEQIETLSELVGSLNRRITSLEATMQVMHLPSRPPPLSTTTGVANWYWNPVQKTWGKV